MAHAGGGSDYDDPTASADGYGADAVVRGRPVPAYQITTLHPRTYNEARTIGEHFRKNTPVIMNLSEMEDADAKRLVDFAAGLTFGLHGRIERVTAKVFLLSPHNVTVTAAGQGPDRRDRLLQPELTNDLRPIQPRRPGTIDRCQAVALSGAALGRPIRGARE